MRPVFLKRLFEISKGKEEFMEVILSKTNGLQSGPLPIKKALNAFVFRAFFKQRVLHNL